jgi:hypothetical protein
MPKLSALNERLEDGMQHDRLSTQCEACPNVITSTTKLGRTALRCGLLTRLREDVGVYEYEYDRRTYNGKKFQLRQRITT